MPPATASALRAPTAGGGFPVLLRLVRQADLLRRRRAWYAAAITVNLLALGAIGTGIVLLGDSWWTVALAVPAAVFWARTAFLGHDCGHSQIATGRRANRLLGLFHGDLLIGMGYAWWTEKHNRHHANPNHVGKDPDVGAGALVWTRGQAAVRQGFARWLAAHQAGLFFPLLLLEGANLKAASALHLRRMTPAERAVEGPLLVLHFAGYWTLLLTSMSPGKAIVFALLHHALFGVHLGMAFAPNHKGMEMPDPDGERLDRLRKQVLTSRNVRGGVLTDWFLGGLNYQIEHHLFPNLPRPHLRRVQPLVRAYCRDVGVSYAETGLIDSYRQGLRHMHEVGTDLG